MDCLPPVRSAFICGDELEGVADRFEVRTSGLVGELVNSCFSDF
jgi:hypothetical protein